MTVQWKYDQQKIANQARQAWNRLNRAINNREHSEYHLYGGRGLKFKNWSQERFETWFRYNVAINKIIKPAVTLRRPFEDIKPDNVLLDEYSIVLSYRNKVERAINQFRDKDKKGIFSDYIRYTYVARPQTILASKKRAEVAWANIKSKCENPRNRFYKNFGGKGIRVEIKKADFVDWFVKEQNKYELSKPAVKRKNSSDNFNLNNLKLIEFSDLMRKEGKISSPVPIALIPDVGEIKWFRSIADLGRYIRCHPTTIREAVKENKMVKGKYKVSIDPDSKPHVTAKVLTNAA